MTKPLAVRLPNETNYQEVKIDIDFFNLVREHEDEVYGWYKGNHIYIKK
jgi:hypothetical protein